MKALHILRMLSLKIFLYDPEMTLIGASYYIINCILGKFFNKMHQVNTPIYNFDAI